MNDYKMKPQALFTFKLGSDEQDFSIIMTAIGRTEIGAW